MTKFFRTLKTIFSIGELKQRIFNTILFLVIFRLGSYVVLPGIEPSMLTGKMSGVFGLLDAFLGGAFSNASILGLGVMPYISASIAVQLLTIMTPYFQKMQREGQSGRDRLNQITRGLTVLLALGQSVGYLSTAIPSDAIAVSKSFFISTSMVIITAGAMFCVWLGEKITDRGIGNGISMLIMVNIVSSLPGAIIAEVVDKGSDGLLLIVIEMTVLFFIMLLVIMFTQATRKVPIQYAKQIAGGAGLKGGQRQYLPLKLNSSGVMPIIFANALMLLPILFSSFWSDKSDVAASIGRSFSDFTSWQYNITFAVLIMLFTFFYTAITINPHQIAEDMKRNGGFIPGVKPGKTTATFIDAVVSRVTLPGSLFLAMIAVLPAVSHLAGVSKAFCRFYGGSSLLILIGVVLDTLQQIESYLLMRYYEGMMKSGKVGREY